MGFLSGGIGQHHLHLHAVDDLTVERRHGVVCTLSGEHATPSLLAFILKSAFIQTSFLHPMPPILLLFTRSTFSPKSHLFL